MIGGSPSPHATAEYLLALAMSRPSEARQQASAVLSGSSSVLDRTYAMQALGIVERDSGHVGLAIGNFRQGLYLSQAAGLGVRELDLAASLGTALAMAGRRQAALRVLDEAVSGSKGSVKARVLVRRAGVRELFNDFEGAYQDGMLAAEILRRAGDRTWEARARNNVGHVLLGLGRFAAAEEQHARAQELAETQGQDYDATTILHNRGDCAHRRGDLPSALRLLYRARDRYRELGVVPPEVVRDIAVVLLAAGLTEEATLAADELVDVLDADRASAGRRADGLDHGGDSAP
jgi:tetratricopeptide (TPR) repeat protein